MNGGPYRAIHAGNVATPPREVEDLYARLVDFLRNVLDVADVASSTEMLGYGDEIDGWLAEMRALGWEVAMGSRQVALTKGRLPTMIAYLMAIPIDCGSRHVAVPKDVAEQDSPTRMGDVPPTVPLGTAEPAGS